MILLKLVAFFTTNKSQSPENRYCCAFLCDQKGFTGPNGGKVGFFIIPTKKHLKEQSLHAIRREPGKYLSVTDSTKVVRFILKLNTLRHHGRWIDSAWKSRSYAGALKENPINIYIF